MDLIQKVEQTVKAHGLFSQGDWVVAGISGGPDSVCMVHVLNRLRDTLGIRLLGVHINHQLRGDAADRDQQYAESFCAGLGIPCESHRFDVAALAGELGLSTEDAGRRVRYETFFAKAGQLTADGAGAVKVAVAQNQDDQAETVLMRIMRGTGIEGLSGIRYKRADGVVRPLLDVSREEIEGYCLAEGLSPCIDKTNLEPVYTRNRIRLELLPYMRDHFNENVTGALTRLAAIAGEEGSYLEAETEKLFKLHAQTLHERRDEPSGWLFPLAVIRNQHPAIRKRLITALLKAAGLAVNVTALHLNQADQLLMKGSGPAELDFPDGFVMKIRYGDVCFASKSSPAEPRRSALGQLTQTVVEQGCFDLQLHLTEAGQYVKCFDLDAVEEQNVPLVLRTRRAGDFIRPLGMRGKKKIQDYFVDRKIRREERDHVPLVALGPEILWVVGGQTSENFKVKPDTKRILLLEYVPNIW